MRAPHDPELTGQLGTRCCGSPVRASVSGWARPEFGRMAGRGPKFQRLRCVASGRAVRCLPLSPATSMKPPLQRPTGGRGISRMELCASIGQLPQLAFVGAGHAFSSVGGRLSLSRLGRSPIDGCPWRQAISEPLSRSPSRRTLPIHPYQSRPDHSKPPSTDMWQPRRLCVGISFGTLFPGRWAVVLALAPCRHFAGVTNLPDAGSSPGKVARIPAIWKREKPV